MVFRLKLAISMFGYWQLIHVEGEPALHTVLVIKVESRYLKGHMFKGASLVPIGDVGSCSVIKVQLLERSIVDILYTNGKPKGLFVIFVRKVTIGRD